jgi:Xaa-Pro aminopeptidase
MYEAIFAARDAALETIRPGVKGAEVDRAAREVIESRLSPEQATRRRRDHLRRQRHDRDLGGALH